MEGSTVIRKALFALAALLPAIVLAASASGGTAAPTASTDLPGCAKDSLNLINDGQLTIGTDNPAFPPWFGGGEKNKPWKINDPSTGKGFESAVAYAVAKQLGFSRDQVKWVYVPFAKSYAPGRKNFDFDINQISFSPERARAVSFSASYYDVKQSIVVRKGTPIASVRSIAGLQRYKLGAQLGTTSYQFIAKTIKPSQQPGVYPTNTNAVNALKNGQIDGLVVDLPTAFYVTAVQVPNSKILGQFRTPPGGEHFGMVFQKGNSLVGCVNKALTRLKANGTLKAIERIWLRRVTGAPILE
jgi:polar amino acid transport system substrate-binding protein